MRRAWPGAAETVAEFHEPESPLKKLQHWLHQTPSAVPMIVLLVALVVFGLLADNFFKAGRCRRSCSRSPSSASWAARRRIVVLTAGIDLSVGAIAVFSSVLMGQIHLPLRASGPLAIAIGLVLGTAMGAERLADRPAETAALHRDAGHLADPPRLELHLFRERNHPVLRHRGDGPGPAASGARTWSSSPMRR
jgi:hypothetical protein